MRASARQVLAHRWTAIAAAYFAALVVAGLVSTPREGFSGLYTLVPVLLALEWGPLVVAAGSAVLVVLTATNTFGLTTMTTEATIVRSVGVTVGIAIAVYVAAYREHHEVALGHSRAATRAAHEAILPVVPSAIGSFRFSCAYRSAAQESHVGGDFYKVIATEFGVRTILGDVRGKGLGAISMTAAVLGCFREWAPETVLLKALVGRLDARVADRGEYADFVTAVVATFDDGLAEIANCGHPSPIHFTRGRPQAGVIPAHRTTPLGLAPNPALTALALAPGDRVLFFTDGLIECRDRSGAWIELDAAMLETVGSDPMEEALGGLLRRVEQGAGALRDDVALLLVEYAPVP
jgi:sigma-B regulation protein RsbU (phosphoserine phosphatase)